MSPIILSDNPNSWVTNTVKLPKELNTLVEEYQKIQGLETKSAAIRELLGLVLDSGRVVGVVLRANANAAAINALAKAVDKALVEFWDLVKEAE